MDAKRLTYWNGRVLDDFQRCTKSLGDYFRSIQDVMLYIDPASEPQVYAEIEKVKLAMRGLANMIDETVKKKGDEINERE